MLRYYHGYNMLYYHYQYGFNFLYIKKNFYTLIIMCYIILINIICYIILINMGFINNEHSVLYYIFNKHKSKPKPILLSTWILFSYICLLRLKVLINYENILFSLLWSIQTIDYRVLKTTKLRQLSVETTNNRQPSAYY